MLGIYIYYFKGLTKVFYIQLHDIDYRNFIMVVIVLEMRKTSPIMT